MLEICNSIMLIKAYFGVHFISYEIFESTQDIFSRFNSDTYQSDIENETDDQVNDVEEIISFFNNNDDF
jgi:hypothetical protein